MLIKTLSDIFERDLNKLKDEINLYEDESKLWKLSKEINNAAGNLCLHLIGNLNHFIGSILGNSGYKRERDLEFSKKNVKRSDLLEMIDDTKVVVNKTLSSLRNNDLHKNFPVEKHGEIVTTNFMLIHLITHFNYHLGQINYHRRLIRDNI